MDFSKLSF